MTVATGETSIFCMLIVICSGEYCTPERSRDLVVGKVNWWKSSFFRWMVLGGCSSQRAGSLEKVSPLRVLSLC